jgi:hypothetical protein
MNVFYVETRLLLENALIQYLTNYIDIDDDFWDPVKVVLTNEQIDQIPTIIKNEECVICSEQQINFKNLNCCKNDICDSCASNWFNESVNCPYCKKDLREVI